MEAARARIMLLTQSLLNNRLGIVRVFTTASSYVTAPILSTV
jgi:hypothetical protein